VRIEHACLRWILNIEGSRNPRLVRWRLHLSELEFDVAYKQGMTHYRADSISRLESGASDETAFDDAVPVFATRANTVRGLDAANYVGGPTVRGINRDTVLSAQAADGYCQEVVKALSAGRRIPFFEDPDGILRRRAAPDGAHQVVVPASLQEQVLDLEHNETLAGHPGESRMYAAMRRYYYWVGMAADIVSYAGKCDSCARQRVGPLARRSPLTAFPATMPFQDIAVDLHGPFARTAAGHRFILVITDRFTKLVRALPMDGTTVVDCASVPFNSLGGPGILYRRLWSAGPVAVRRGTAVHQILLGPGVQPALHRAEGNVSVPPADERADGAVQPHLAHNP